MPGDILRSKNFHSMLGALVSIVLIVWLLFSLEWGRVWSELHSIRYWALLPSLLILLMHFALRSLRWRFLLRDGARLQIAKLFDAIMIGNFANLVLPLRAGELIRPYTLSLSGEVTFAAAFVSVVIERFLDLSAVLFSFLLVVVSVKKLPPLATQGAISLGLVALGILLVMVVGTLMPMRIVKLAEFCLRLFPRGFRDWVLKFLREFLDGAAVLARGRNLLAALLLTVLVWATCYLQFYVFFYLFAIPASAKFAITTAVMVALAVALPSAPGFIGVYQTGCIAAFALFSVSKETAMAYSLITHIFQYLIFVPYGIWLLSKYKLSLKQLRGAAQKG